MKNLILTFVFTLISVVSFSQNYEDSLNVDTVTVNQTIYVFNADSLTVLSIAENNVIIKLCDNNFVVQSWLHNSQESYATDTLSNDTLYLKIYPGNGVVISFDLTVIFTESLSTSETSLIREELKVYPSPASSNIKISFFADKSDMPLNIFSLNGQLILSDINKREKGMNDFELNVDEFVPGIYFVKVGNHTEKLIIE